jgi:Holliday junction resolvase RusA-like endonuclease
MRPICLIALFLIAAEKVASFVIDGRYSFGDGIRFRFCQGSVSLIKPCASNRMTTHRWTRKSVQPTGSEFLEYQSMTMLMTKETDSLATSEVTQKKSRRTTSKVQLQTNDNTPSSVDERVAAKSDLFNAKLAEQRLHWKLDTDEFLVDFTHNETDNTHFLSKIRFDIRGNPLPLRRHRSSRGFMYNPSAGAQESFRQTVQSIVNSHRGSANNTQYPLFAAHHLLRMTMIFYLKRPKSHFIGSRPGPGRLRDCAPHSMSLSKKDVDNLAKFVMDSLNGIAYADDHQIGCLHVTKLLDDCDECLGKTSVLFEVLTKDGMEGLLL